MTGRRKQMKYRTLHGGVMGRSRTMVVKSLARLLAWLGILALIAGTPTSASAARSAPGDGARVTLLVVDGLPTLPGEMIESPPPPPPETVEYYAIDAIGSTRVVFAPDGTVLSRGDYTPFGDELPGANLPPERFTGQQRDAEAGFDYFGARSYQLRTGRFSGVDPDTSGAALDPQRWNRYTYALNNPLRYTDPTGMNANPCAGDTNDACVVGHAPTDNPGSSTNPDQGFSEFQLNMALGFLNMGTFIPGSGSSGPGGGANHTDSGGGVEPTGDPGGGFPVPCGGPSQMKCPETKTDLVLANVDLVLGAMAPLDVGLQLGSKAVSTIVDEGTKLLTPAINITEQGMAHVIDRHVADVAKFADRSKFDVAVDLVRLIREGTQMPMLRQANGNFARIFKAGKVIGIDRATGEATSTLTIITGPTGNLITMFPGRP